MTFINSFDKTKFSCVTLPLIVSLETRNLFALKVIFKKLLDDPMFLKCQMDSLKAQ